MEAWQIVLLIIVLFFIIDIFFLPRIKPTDQDKRREAYQKRIKEEHAKREQAHNEE